MYTERGHGKDTEFEQEIFKKWVKAESFYSDKYGSSSITPIILSNHLVFLMSFQMFFKQSAILAFVLLFWF